MQIDWITVSAQIINFLILVWLLKHFLYQPVINAMDRREQRITERLKEAQERESQAEEKIHHYQVKSEKLDGQREEILDKVKEEAEQHRKQMLDEARAQVGETREQWQRDANREKAEFLDNLQRQIVEAIESIARKALAELADDELEERLVQKFLTQLQTLDKDARRSMSQTNEPVRIASAFELDSSMRSRLTRAVHEHLANGIDVNYELSPDLLCGIELTSGGRRLSWNLANFTEELTNRIDEAFSPTAAINDKGQ